MKYAAILLMVIAVCAIANQVAINPVQVNQLWDWLRYDDGTYNWLTWGGTYRGVWFDIQDFIPGHGPGLVSMVEVWFYHHSSYPWDTSDAYVEVWNGDETGPTTVIDQTMISATHATPVYVTYEPPLEVGENWWVLINTEMSAGGWPALLGDNMNTTVSHSFYSDDFIVWEPWTINSACNYFIASYWGWESFNSVTWGALKTVF